MYFWIFLLLWNYTWLTDYFEFLVRGYTEPIVCGYAVSLVKLVFSTIQIFIELTIPTRKFVIGLLHSNVLYFVQSFWKPEYFNKNNVTILFAVTKQNVWKFFYLANKESAMQVRVLYAICIKSSSTLPWLKIPYHLALKFNILI